MLFQSQQEKIFPIPVPPIGFPKMKGLATSLSSEISKPLIRSYTYEETFTMMKLTQTRNGQVQAMALPLPEPRSATSYPHIDYSGPDIWRNFEPIDRTYFMNGEERSLDSERRCFQKNR